MHICLISWKLIAICKSPSCSCISVNAIAAHIELKEFKELLLLHSLSGCDCTSSFWHVRKVKFWDAWLMNSVVSKTFLIYSNRSTLPLAEENLKVIEWFALSLYATVPDISWSVDIGRYQISKDRDNSEIRSLPPTRDALIQHIHKVTYVSGYIWGTLHIPTRTEKSPLKWTWSFTDNRIKCQWVSYDHCLITQNLNKAVSKKCGCRKDCKRNYKCKKVEMMKCLPTSKYREKFDESWNFIIIKIVWKKS